MASVCLIVCALETSKRGCKATEQNLAVFTQSLKVNKQWYYVSWLRRSSRVSSSFMRKK